MAANQRPGDGFSDTYHHVEEINTLLSMYGRDLYKSGRPLAHYSETINFKCHRKLEATTP